MITISINPNEPIGFIWAKACLSAAAQYAEENDLVIVGERDEYGKVHYWFEEGRK